ncbi:hypothetical protein [Phenylobacterium sp.]|uniref:hypothetical protein n=1 Tax=Phenylobacterium sp. TaxID=1871053 RepID=UPI0025CF7E40|nr:hypothetical protein [Phenylobacterium sp.]
MRALCPALALAAWAGAAQAVTLAVCRTLDVGGAPSAPLTVPAGSLFRDAGRADDPLAAFTADHWSLRLETVAPAQIPALQTCVAVQARITSDSAVKAVGRADNRSLVYAGSSDLLTTTPTSEPLLSLTAIVID